MALRAIALVVRAWTRNGHEDREWSRGTAKLVAIGRKTTPLTNETVALSIPGGAVSWSVTFFDTFTGDAMTGGGTLTANAGVVLVPLPAFSDDIAFTMIPGGA